jgi:PAS domain S-box-containing protein
MKSSLEGLFKILAEKSPNMIFINTGGRVVYANKRCEEIMGYSREEFYSEDFDFITLIAPEFRDLVRENFKIHMSGKDIPPYEYKLITKDGREISAIHHTKLIEYEGRKAILGIVSDITTQKTLIESEVKFKSLVENSLVGVYLIQDYIFKYVNPKLAELFGYSQEDLIEKKGPRDLTYPDDWPIVKENLRKRFEGKAESINYTFRGQKKSGEVFDVEVFGSRIIYNGKPAVVGTLLDITERKLRTEEIKRQYDTQRVLSNLLQLSLEDISLEEILDRALEQILSLPWLTFQQRGIIFLVEDETLIMKAQREITHFIKKSCLKVPFGQCICGRAAATKKIQFVDHLDDTHTTTYEGIVPHGHYSVPILYGEMTIGVINIYLEEGHKESRIEKDFLSAVANTFAGIIQRKWSERAVLESETKLKTIFNNSPDVMMMVTPSGVIKSANRTTFKTLGYFEDTLLDPP